MDKYINITNIYAFRVYYPCSLGTDRIIRINGYKGKGEWVVFPTPPDPHRSPLPRHSGMILSLSRGPGGSDRVRAVLILSLNCTVWNESKSQRVRAGPALLRLRLSRNWRGQSGSLRLSLSRNGGRGGSRGVKNTEHPLHMWGT